MKGRSRGYNLVEVLIAMALLSTVMLTIITLFYVGRRNIYSGKEMTQAVSVGTRAMEDLSRMTRADLYAAFNITGTTTLGPVDVDPTQVLPNDLYDNSILRTSLAYVAADDPCVPVAPATTCVGFLGRWRDMMNPPGATGSRFAGGSVSIVVTPTQSTTANAVTGANLVRARVLIRWVEGENRTRQLILDTVKVFRPSS